MPAHTPDHIDCRACRERSIAGRSVLRADMKFEEAFEVWMGFRAGVRAKRFGKAKKWRAGTVERYQQYGDSFSSLFGRVPLGEICDGHLNEYAENRAASGCGQNSIRKETDMVVRVLRDAHLWTKSLDKAYKLLRLPILDSDDQRALDELQIKKLIEVLSHKSEESLWVLYDSIVALHTCTSTNERRLAKIRHVQLALRIFRVGPEQSKNKYRNRRVPLETEEVIFALEWLLARAAEKGATEPDHYLFPKRLYEARDFFSRYDRVELYEKVWVQPVQQVAREYGISDVRLGKVCRSLSVPLPGRGYWNKRAAGKAVPARPELKPIEAPAAKYDPTQPMTRWCLSQQFEGVGKEIGVDDFTPYDLRHTAMSMLANVGTPIDVILAYGGQVSEKMRQHYVTASTLAKSKAAPEAWKDLRLLDSTGMPLVPKKHPCRVIPIRARSYA